MICGTSETKSKFAYIYRFFCFVKDKLCLVEAGGSVNTTRKYSGFSLPALLTLTLSLPLLHLSLSVTLFLTISCPRQC